MTLRPASLAVLLACAAPAAAQTGSSPPDPGDGVRAAVAELFDGMRAADTTQIRAVLHPALRLMTVVDDGAGVRVAETGLDPFLAAVAGAPVVLDERVGEVEVRTDGDLATAWMPYRFYAGEQFSHCGTNAMQLVRDGDDLAGGAGWRIVHVVDTRRTEGCE